MSSTGNDDWPGTLETLRRRVDALRGAFGAAGTLSEAEGVESLARLRELARPLLEATQERYRDLCPPGFPVLEDNGITGAGGSIGLRFSVWHSVFFALEHVKRRQPAEARPAGLAGALGVPMKRLPGQPLPPRDPHLRLELVSLALRWDEDRGWVELRRRLHPAWDESILQDFLAMYLAGFNYDVASGLPLAAHPPALDGPNPVSSTAR